VTAGTGGDAKQSIFGDVAYVVEIGVDFLPGIGTAKGFYDAYQNPSKLNIAIAVLGVLPGGRVLGVAGKTAINVLSKPRSIDAALSLGERWLKPGYLELGNSGSGVFRSADNSRQFRMSVADVVGRHGTIGPHVHFEKFNSSGVRTKNIHTPILP
jgi:hypothetical protein